MNRDEQQTLLLKGSIEVEGRVVASSNQALLVTVSLDGLEGQACYKAEAGERPLWDFPDGESFTEMQLRMWTALERIAAKHRNRTVVVVSHADPIKAAVTYAQGVPLDLFQRTVISTCSVSALAIGAGRLSRGGRTCAR